MSCLSNVYHCRGRESVVACVHIIIMKRGHGTNNSYTVDVVFVEKEIRRLDSTTTTSTGLSWTTPNTWTENGNLGQVEVQQDSHVNIERDFFNVMRAN